MHRHLPGGASCTLAPAGPTARAARSPTARGQRGHAHGQGRLRGARHDKSDGSDSTRHQARDRDRGQLPGSVALNERVPAAPPSPTPTGATRPRPGLGHLQLDPSSVAGAPYIPGGASSRSRRRAPTARAARSPTARRPTRARTWSRAPTRRLGATKAPAATRRRHQARDRDRGQLPRLGRTERAGSCSATVSDTDGGDKASSTGRSPSARPELGGRCTGSSPAAPAARSPRRAPTARAARSPTARRPTRARTWSRAPTRRSARHKRRQRLDTSPSARPRPRSAAPARSPCTSGFRARATVSDTDARRPSPPPGRSPSAPTRARCAVRPDLRRRQLARAGGPQQRELLGQLPPAATAGTHMVNGRLRRRLGTTRAAGSDSTDVTKRSTSTAVAAPRLARTHTRVPARRPSPTPTAAQGLPSGRSPSAPTRARCAFHRDLPAAPAARSPRRAADSASCSVSYRPAATAGTT